MSTDHTTAPAAGTLEKVVTPTVITTAADFRESRALWVNRKYHVLTPVADFQALPPHFALMPAQVQINPDIEAGEVYRDPLFCEDGEVCLTKMGLAKIALASGMSITTLRTDDRRIQNLWEVKATARFIGIDGTPQDLDATEELDLRDGSARSEKVMGRNRAVGALQASRAKGLRNCEARAINAAIRQFGIKQKYTLKQLEAPFVVLRVVFMPDMTDPETRRFITERALAGTTALYPNATRAALPEPEHLDTIGAEPTATLPREQAPPALLVEKVTSKSGMYKNKPWTLYTVVFNTGAIANTFDEKLRVAAETAARDKTPVDAVIEPTDRGPNLVELTPWKATAAAVAEEEPPMPLPGMKL